MLDTLARVLPYLLIAVLVVNLLQRGLTRTSPSRTATQPGPGAARRMASLLLAGVVLGTWVAVLLLQRLRSPGWTGAPLLAVAAAVTFALRQPAAGVPAALSVVRPAPAAGCDAGLRRRRHRTL